MNNPGLSGVVCWNSNNVSSYISNITQTSQQSIYTIPNGYTGFLFQGEASTGKNKDATVYFKVKLFGHSFKTYDIIHLFQQTVSVKRPFSRIPSKTDLKCSVIAEANSEVSVNYGLILLKNNFYNLS